MGRPVGSNSRPFKRSRIAVWRIERGLSQPQLAALTGIPFRTYRRIESKEIANPPIKHLVNIAMALGVELSEIFEPTWKQWTVFDAKGAPKPPPIPAEWREPSAQSEAGRSVPEARS